MQRVGVYCYLEVWDLYQFILKVSVVVFALFC